MLVSAIVVLLNWVIELEARVAALERQLGEPTEGAMTKKTRQSTERSEPAL